MKSISRHKILLPCSLVVISLANPNYLNANGKNGIVEPQSHDTHIDLEIRHIDDRVDEITRKLKDKNLSSGQLSSLKKQRKELKKRKGEILMKKMGIDPTVKGPVTY